VWCSGEAQSQDFLAYTSCSASAKAPWASLVLSLPPQLLKGFSVCTWETSSEQQGPLCCKASAGSRAELAQLRSGSAGVEGGAGVGCCSGCSPEAAASLPLRQRLGRVRLQGSSAFGQGGAGGRGDGLFLRVELDQAEWW